MALARAALSTSSPSSSSSSTPSPLSSASRAAAAFMLVASGLYRAARHVIRHSDVSVSIYGTRKAAKHGTAVRYSRKHRNEASGLRSPTYAASPMAVARLDSASVSDGSCHSKNLAARALLLSAMCTRRYSGDSDTARGSTSPQTMMNAHA